MKKRVGDTLIEVTLAIGIFSMVAIAVVAVMTGGTSSAETALETTLAREEIDTQAEALRFIHSAFIAGAEADTDDPYVGLWSDIISRAIDPKTNTDYLSYSPKTCQEVQNSSTLKNYGFIINPRALGTNPAGAYVPYSSIFRTASTFPRLVYNTVGEMLGTDILVGQPIGNAVSRVEGIYVIAVKDNNSTQIVGDTSPSKGSGFYDFYIRTCWYGAGANTPSTISTVIRLYNPPDVNDRYTTPNVRINFYPNGGSGSMNSITLKPGQSTTIPNVGFVNEGLNFVKWNTFANGSGQSYLPGSTYRAPTHLSSFQVLNLYAIWDRIKINYNVNSKAGDNTTNIGFSYCYSYDDCYVSSFVPTRSDSLSGFSFMGWATSKSSTTVAYRPGDKIRPSSTSITLYAVWERYEINYDANGGSYAPGTTYCASKTDCLLSSEEPSRSGYRFLGWSTSPSATTAAYGSGQLFTPTAARTTLYAVWEARNERITVVLTWGFTPNDLDSHVEGQKSNGTTFHAYYSNKVGSDIDGSTIASLDNDITKGLGPETFTINTLGGKNYYYYVHNYSGSGRFGNAVVTVTSPSLGTITYYSNEAPGNGRYWNVFAYKDGRIVTRQTFSYSPELNY
ncbi:InlB B-repeat-containing protein [Candidatus Saccharibacteria bacterium]|nr:InlB B-repeat-containing protein [Candidatus Saccharibacteria bacterium]